MAKGKRIKLEVPHEKTMFFAISCSDSLHKLAWHINSDLSLQLSDYEGLTIEEFTFPCHKDETSLPEISLLIVKNKVESSILFKELSNVDYVFKIQGNYLQDDLKKIIATIKKIPSVVAVINLAPQTVKNLSVIQNF